jgi:integrase
VPTREPGTVWTIARLQAFLATVRQHRLFAFFHLAAYIGARRGELLNLRWADVDLDAKKITISGSTAVIGGERINGTTNTMQGTARPARLGHADRCRFIRVGPLPYRYRMIPAACPWPAFLTAPGREARNLPWQGFCSMIPWSTVCGLLTE